MAQATPSRSKQDMKQGSVVGSPPTSQRLPGSSLGWGGRQGRSRGQGCSRGQGRDGGQDQHSRPNSGLGRCQGGRHELNRGKLNQPSAQPQNTFQSASQISYPWPGPTVGHIHSMAPLQPAAQLSHTVARNKEGVRKDGEGTAAVRRNRRERGSFSVRGHGSGRGTVPSTTVAEIASTSIANGLASPVLSSLEKITKNLLLKENEVGNPITAKDKSKDSEDDHVENSEEGCISSRMNGSEEIDSQSVQRPLCDDQSTVYYESSDRDSVSQSSSCVLEGQEREVASSKDVEVADEISLGNAKPYQQTRPLSSRGRGESHSRGRRTVILPSNFHDPTLGFGRDRLYFGAQVDSPDVKTLWTTKAVLGNSQNVLGGRAQQSRTAQRLTLTEEWKVTNEPKQRKDSNPNRGQCDRIKCSEDKKERRKTSNGRVVKGDLANSSSQLVFEVDQNLVIDYLFNHHNGSCMLFDFRNNSGIFSCILQAKEVLHSLRFCCFIRVLIDPSDLDNSIVTVYMNKLRLCVEYRPPRSCSRSNCQYIHLCREFMMDCCFSLKCTLSHDVESEHNMKIMIEYGIEIFNADQKLSLIRCSNLLVCSEHNSSEGCLVPNSCLKIHVCNSYIMNKCLIPGNKCPQGHDLFNVRNMKILRLYEVDQLKLNFLLRMVVGFLDERFNKGSSLVMRGRHKAFAGRTKPTGDSSSYSGRVQVSGWGAIEQKVTDSSASTDCTESYKSEKHSFTSNSQRKSNLPRFGGTVQEKFIVSSSACEETQGADLSRKEQQNNGCSKSFEEHTCDQMQGCTKRHGSQTPYLWRIRMDTKWFDLENNELIEEEFSNPAAEKFWGSMSDMTVCIDFSSMMSEVGAIQRLSTPSHAVCRDRMDATRWLWYWLDATGNWVLYGQNNQPPYQDVLEAKFLNNSRSVCCYKINGFNCELDFAKMEQKDLQTNFCCPIRRRPFYRNFESMEMPNIKYHSDNSKIPCGWAPMDTESKHRIELVPLLLDDADCKTIKCHFVTTLTATHFEIQRIYRLQNLDLWQSFQMKKVLMEKKTGSQVEEVQVYHGTPEEETVRWICSLGFDQRMHGRHGAKYGTGVYFATTASFSHLYTHPSEKGLRYMFCARVLVGRTVEGKGEYRRPPPIDPTKPTEGLYDTCVNNIAKPSIYVVFDNNQSYPEYLIEYRDAAAVSAADACQSHPASASATTTLDASRHIRAGFYGAPPPTSAVNPPYSASTSSPAGHNPYFSPIPATTYPLQADLSASATASVPSYQSSASAAPNQPQVQAASPSDDSLSHPSYSDDKLISCHIM